MHKGPLPRKALLPTSVGALLALSVTHDAFGADPAPPAATPAATAAVAPARASDAAATRGNGPGRGDPQHVTELGAVTVTGTRTVAPARQVVPNRAVASVYGTSAAVVDVPRVVSEVNSEQLHNDVIRSTDDFVKYAPGITRGGGQNVSGAPQIRGQASEIYQNGQRIYSQANDHPINMNAYEAADIVAGPSSVVFGPGSNTGGYVNYITKQPDFDAQHSEVKAKIGTWVPGDNSFHDNAVTFDTTGPINDQLAYRLSVTKQAADTYYNNVQNNFNAIYGALSWKPKSNVRIDFNGAYDDYYDFNITRGWNRNTQQMVDDVGTYYAGRATPLISSPGAGIWSPVFASGAANSSVIGWQQRTPNSQNQYIAGPVQTTPLPNSTPDKAGKIVGWVYDPNLPGNGATKLNASQGSGQPDDRNSARRINLQLRETVDLSPTLSIVNSTYYQRSDSFNNSVGSFFVQAHDNLFENRVEVRKTFDFSTFGLNLKDESNTGVSYRRESFEQIAANNNFNFSPYDLTQPSNTQNPGALLGLPTPAGPGSWIGQAGVPQHSSYFGYLNLPPMVKYGDLYAEKGGFPPNGAVYTSAGRWTDVSLFTQHNLRIADRIGVNVGFSETFIDATMNNPVVLTPADVRSSSGSFKLPSVQASVYFKPTEGSTVYFTYDRSQALNTGVFTEGLVWGPGNALNPDAFHSVSELYEIGAKFQLSKSLFASIAAYQQTRDTSPDTNGNMAKLRVKGIDGALRFQPDRHLSAGLNATVLQARYTSVVPGGFSPFGFYADNQTVFGDSNALNKRPAGAYPAPGIPKWSVNGFVNYQFDSGFGAQVSAWWTSGWYTNLSQTVRVPNEYNVDVALYYRQPRWDVSLNFMNVTNQHNFVQALNAGGTGEFLQPLMPFAILAQVAYRF
ncbi:TonB-dependent receptor [Burkholderia lata]|uniref:TonB-dependent receptor n=2 Tax=Burkholderia cepacia complex TaxID=87882 RepID=UPI000F07D049|nr:TonB-dependent receptor plug domain-containing protein [Burkholderia lata]AYQ43651.1 TonB-dependent receptor [Burkholderia lata]